MSPIGTAYEEPETLPEAELNTTEPAVKTARNPNAKYLKSIPHPVASALKERFPHGINWTNFWWMLIMNVGAVAALWHFTWAGLWTAVALHFVTACFGVTLGYHRLLTHGSFTTPKWFEYFCSICGMLSAEGTPLYWVATHRKHHVLSDQTGDPHSPNEGFWWAHFLWFTPRMTDEEEQTLRQRWAPDMYADPVQRLFDKIFPVFPIALGAALYFIGEATMGNGLSLMLWGLCVRMIACYHSTWFVNSATHSWGYRNYESTDRSRNLWWVALVSYGEGWHNNHHAHQLLARHGHRWWEIDVTYMVIWVLKQIGLAKNVHDRLPSQH